MKRRSAQTEEPPDLAAGVCDWIDVTGGATLEDGEVVPTLWMRFMRDGAVVAEAQVACTSEQLQELEDSGRAAVAAAIDMAHRGQREMAGVGQ